MQLVAIVVVVAVVDVVVLSVVDAVVVVVAVEEEVVVVVQAELQIEQADEASIYTRGWPDAIGTAMLPLESTVTAVQVYISMRFVPEA